MPTVRAESYGQLTALENQKQAQADQRFFNSIASNQRQQAFNQQVQDTAFQNTFSALQFVNRLRQQEAENYQRSQDRMLSAAQAQQARQDRFDLATLERDAQEKSLMKTLEQRQLLAEMEAQVQKDIQSQRSSTDLRIAGSREATTVRGQNIDYNLGMSRADATVEAAKAKALGDQAKRNGEIFWKSLEFGNIDPAKLADDLGLPEEFVNVGMARQEQMKLYELRKIDEANTAASNAQTVFDNISKEANALQEFGQSMQEKGVTGNVPEDDRSQFLLNLKAQNIPLSVDTSQLKKPSDFIQQGQRMKDQWITQQNVLNQSRFVFDPAKNKFVTLPTTRFYTSEGDTIQGVIESAARARAEREAAVQEKKKPTESQSTTTATKSNQASEQTSEETIQEQEPQTEEGKKLKALVMAAKKDMMKLHPEMTDEEAELQVYKNLRNGPRI